MPYTFDETPAGDSKEPLLDQDEIGDGAMAVHIPSPRASRGGGIKLDNKSPEPTFGALAILFGILGAFLTLIALGLHYSGLEAVDLNYFDDKCFNGSAVTVNDLPVDACMTRESVDSGTDCGEPAANAFCVLKGGNYYVNFTLGAASGKHGAFSLGNKFIGGQLTFQQVCCDVGAYEPAWSRVLLSIGGTGLIFLAATLAASLMLSVLEASAAWLHLEAGEVLYFLLGVESPLKWVLFSVGLLEWLHYTLWVVWCTGGIDCEAHGSETRTELYRAAQVLLMFSSASFFAKAAPRVISVKYLYNGQFARVRETMRRETLLAALTRPEVQEIVRARQQAQQAGASTSTAPAPHVRSRGRGPLKKVGADLGRMLEATGYSGAGLWDGESAVGRFRKFLDHYSNASQDDLADEAAAEGAVLFDNLIGSWDVNQDGAVGEQDFKDLFKKVKPPPGFHSAGSAARHAWHMFDLNKDGKLGKDEVIKALSVIYQDRANTARTVLSNESAVRSLEAAFGFVLYTLLAFVAANMLGLSTNPSGEGQSSLDFFTTYILALSFIFGDTVRSVFRSTLYLFGEQPFAVGDYLDIDGELWCVESFDLIYTQLRKWEVNLYAKVPNDMLIDSKLVNVSKSGSFKDSIEMSAPLEFPTEAIEAMRVLLLEAGAARPKDVVPDSPFVKISSVESGQVMDLVVEWVYAFPPGDRQRVDDTRDYMVAAARDALVASGIHDRTLKLDFKLAKKKA